MEENNKKLELKIKWDYFEFTPIYKQKEKEFNKIFLEAESKIAEFEKENDLELIVFFNHKEHELSLYSCLPDNYETKVKCVGFLDYLNQYLKTEVEYPQVS